MRKTVTIGLILSVAAIIIFWIFSKNKKGSVACVQTTKGRFTQWIDDKIPSGDLNRIAAEYLEGDSQANGSLVGGFFKAINVYPSTAAAKYYANQLREWANNRPLPYWNVQQGELVC